MLVRGLESCEWDVGVFTETWREQSYEKLTLQGGHTWCGGGGMSGERGTGFLINRKWSAQGFYVVNERLSYVDVTNGSGFIFRLVAVYMPHA